MGCLHQMPPLSAQGTLGKKGGKSLRTHAPIPKPEAMSHWLPFQIKDKFSSRESHWGRQAILKSEATPPAADGQHGTNSSACLEALCVTMLSQGVIYLCIHPFIHFITLQVICEYIKTSGLEFLGNYCVSASTRVSSGISFPVSFL